MRPTKANLQKKLKRATRWLTDVLRALNPARVPALAPVPIPARRPAPRR